MSPLLLIICESKTVKSIFMHKTSTPTVCPRVGIGHESLDREVSIAIDIAFVKYKNPGTQ